MTPETLRVLPGEEVSAVIEVQNIGRVVDAYSVEVAGLDSAWYTLERATVPLFPGDTESVALALHIPPGGAALAGRYEIAVKVSSSVFPGEETTFHHAVQVEAVTDYTARVRPELVTARMGEYSLFVTNTGNTEITLDLDGADPEGLCRFSFVDNPLAVSAGESRDTTALVKPSRRPLVEPARLFDITFNLTPRQSTQRTTLNARLEALPYARKWYFPVALLVILLLAWMSYSVYWFALERDDLTYLRNEKWDDFSEATQVSHGHIGVFEFEIASDKQGPVPSPPPISLRGSVTWLESGDMPPTMGIVIRDPFGNCWGPRLVDWTAEPFHFPVHEGGEPCHSLDYGWLLMDMTLPQSPAPAVYVAGQPLTEYCVRDVEKNPVVKFFEDGYFQTPYRLSDDYSAREVALPSTSTQEERWTVYAVNPHPKAQWPVVPEIVVQLKAVSQEPHSWKKDKTYTVDRLDLPHPQIAAPHLQCGWDTEKDIPGEEGGLEHGVLYVRRLHLSHRAGDEDPGTQVIEDIGHYGCPREREDAMETRLRLLCGDVTWERTRTDNGDITADSVFIILRHSLEEESNCWSKVERHSSADSLGTPFTFNLEEGGRPCHEELADPGQTLWNLMNWNTFEPARYQGVQPLVKFCPHESGQTLFDQRTAVPLLVRESWEQNRTPGWTIYILNPSSAAAAPRVTLKFRGDQFWKVELQELPNTTLGDTPLVPPGSSGCPAPVAN